MEAMTPMFDAADIAAMTAQAKAKMAARTDLVRFKTTGDIRIRLLPSGGEKLNKALHPRPQLWRKFGTHVIPHNEKYIRFVCDWHTNDRSCPIDVQINEYQARKRKFEAEGGVIDRNLDNLILGSKASERYLVNALVDQAPGFSGDRKAIYTLDLTKSQMQVILSLLNRTPLLADPFVGSWINIQADKMPTGNGVAFLPMGVEPASYSGVEIEALPDLDEVLAREHRNAHPASMFTGDFYNPLPASGGFALAAPVPALSAAPIASPALSPGRVSVAGHAASSIIPAAKVLAPAPATTAASVDDDRMREYAAALGVDIESLRSLVPPAPTSAAPAPAPVATTSISSATTPISEPAKDDLMKQLEAMMGAAK